MVNDGDGMANNGDEMVNDGDGMVKIWRMMMMEMILCMIVMIC
jgi:hypothetical protein